MTVCIVVPKFEEPHCGQCGQPLRRGVGQYSRFPLRIFYELAYPKDEKLDDGEGLLV